jgi:hypoxanthine phosphoribosyltransferase
MEFQHFRGKRPPRFAHESERELAELLDAEGIPWEYEPRMFPLRVSADGRLLEAVRPDFYLPEADMYIECTEMKPSLASRKRRKLRQLRTLYGEVVTLVERSDFERLRAKYGQASRRRNAHGRGSSGNGARPTLATTKRPSASGSRSSAPGFGGGASRSSSR